MAEFDIFKSNNDSCSDCGKSFSHKSYLIIYYRSHICIKLFKCITCQIKYSQGNSLKTREKMLQKLKTITI